MNKPLMQQFDLSGKTALVTGGATGMGYHFTRILAEAGATVMIAARREERLIEAANEIAAETGSRVLYKKVDLGDREQAINLVEYANTTMGRLDILVGNAGIEAMEPVEGITSKSYDALLNVNLTSNVFMAKTAVPIMKKRGWGRIIFVSSVSSQQGFKNIPLSVYAATKAGLEGFARFAAVELATDGINVNCISPGGIRTEMLDEALENMGEEQASQFMGYQSSMIAMNRFGEAHELAGTLLLLASDAGSFITGRSYLVDGGSAAISDSITNR